MANSEKISRLDNNSLLEEAMSDQPNAETKEAINEVRSGKTAGKVDMSSFDSFMDSEQEHTPSFSENSLE